MSNDPNQKLMDVKTFRELGYLQELNRCFLHPLGLALEVVVEDDGTERFGKVHDYREDPEGMIFDASVITQEFVDNAKRIKEEMDLKYPARMKLQGYLIQQAKLPKT